jgi:hypothetical protein
MVVTPCGTQAILSLLGILSSSSCTRKPSTKPSTQPRHVASRWTRAASLLPSLSMPPLLSTLEHTSRKSRPDLPISGCSGVLFGEEVPAGKPTTRVLARKQAKKSANKAATRSRRMVASNQWARFYVRFTMLSVQRNFSTVIPSEVGRRVSPLPPALFRLSDVWDVQTCGRFTCRAAPAVWYSPGTGRRTRSFRPSLCQERAAAGQKAVCAT